MSTNHQFGWRERISRGLWDKFRNGIRSQQRISRKLGVAVDERGTEHQRGPELERGGHFEQRHLGRSDGLVGHLDDRV